MVTINLNKKMFIFPAFISIIQVCEGVETGVEENSMSPQIRTEVEAPRVEKNIFFKSLAIFERSKTNEECLLNLKSLCDNAINLDLYEVSDILKQAVTHNKRQPIPKVIAYIRSLFEKVYTPESYLQFANGMIGQRDAMLFLAQQYPDLFEHFISKIPQIKEYQSKNFFPLNIFIGLKTEAQYLLELHLLCDDASNLDLYKISKILEEAVERNKRQPIPRVMAYIKSLFDSVYTPESYIQFTNRYLGEKEAMQFLAEQYPDVIQMFSDLKR